MNNLLENKTRFLSKQLNLLIAGFFGEGFWTIVIQAKLLGAQ